ncbi:MAG: LysE family translocator [Pseudomonadota bacterium]
MEFDLWLAFVAASTALLLIPGPTVLMTLSYAISQGRRVAVSMAAGVALGDFLAMTASLMGLGALVLASATLFTILKWIGAVYLVYLGLRLLRSPPAPVDGIGSPTQMAPRQIFVHATMVTALNPKSIAFFIAFVPQFLRPEAPLLPQFAILIGTFVGLATVNVFAYVFLADQMRARLRRPSVLVWLNRAGGTALIGMGVATAALRRG